MVEFSKEGTAGKREQSTQNVQNVATGEVLDFIEDLSKKRFSGLIEIQFKRGEARAWAKVSKYRKMGGGNGHD